MMSYERALRTGRWLSRRKRVFPAAFFAAVLIALLITPPFTIVLSWTLSTVSIAICAMGFWLRIAASNRASTSIEDTIAAGGVYSVSRFPIYLANTLIIIALSIYTGVFWFMIIMVLILMLCLEKIILSEENTLVNKYGELYTNWSKHTNALMPAMLNWSNTSYKNSRMALIANQSPMLLVIISSYVVINMLKNLLIDFSFKVNIFWLVLLSFALIMYAIIKLKTKK